MTLIARLRESIYPETAQTPPKNPAKPKRYVRFTVPLHDSWSRDVFDNKRVAPMLPLLSETGTVRVYRLLHVPVYIAQGIFIGLGNLRDFGSKEEDFSGKLRRVSLFNRIGRFVIESPKIVADEIKDQIQTITHDLRNIKRLFGGDDGVSKYYSDISWTGGSRWPEKASELSLRDMAGPKSDAKTVPVGHAADAAPIEPPPPSEATGQSISPRILLRKAAQKGSLDATTAEALANLRDNGVKLNARRKTDGLTPLAIALEKNNFVLAVALGNAAFTSGKKLYLNARGKDRQTTMERLLQTNKIDSATVLIGIAQSKSMLRTFKKTIRHSALEDVQKQVLLTALEAHRLLTPATA